MTPARRHLPSLGLLVVAAAVQQQQPDCPGGASTVGSASLFGCVDGDSGQLLRVGAELPPEGGGVPVPKTAATTTTVAVPLSSGDPTGCAVVRLIPKADKKGRKSLKADDYDEKVRRGHVLVVDPLNCAAGSGTFCTIVEAVRAARRLKQQSHGNGAVQVALTKNRMHLLGAEPLVLNENDSHLSFVSIGENNTSTVEAAPIVSGGVAITGWTLANASRGLWVAPLPSAAIHARQLYINGVRSSRARGNASVLFGQLAIDPPNMTSQNGTTARGYRAERATLASWNLSKAADMEFIYTAQILPWVEWRCGLQSISQAKRGLNIEMAPCFSHSPGIASLAEVNNAPDSHVRWYMSGRPSEIENAKELLEHAGSHYIDRSQARVYYLARDHEDMKKAVVVAPVQTSLFIIAGARDISLRDLSFEHTAWHVLVILATCRFSPGFSSLVRGGCFSDTAMRACCRRLSPSPGAAT